MINSMTLLIFTQKVEKVIRDHIEEHQSEVRKGKELMNKLDIARLNQPTQDYSYDLTATGEKSNIPNIIMIMIVMTQIDLILSKNIQ